jgi:hypothetical protein
LPNRTITTSLGAVGQLTIVGLRRGFDLRERRYGLVDGRQDRVNVGDPVKIVLIRRAYGTFRLNSVLERQRDKVGRGGFASKLRSRHEVPSDLAGTPVIGIAGRSR